NGAVNSSNNKLIIRNFRLPRHIGLRGNRPPAANTIFITGATSMLRTIFLIGDDSPSYAALVNLQDTGGFKAIRFHSAEDFLDAVPSGQSGCVLTEIQLAGMDGFELHAALVERRASLPVIFLAAH